MSARRLLLAAAVVAVLVAGIVALIVTLTRHGRPAPSAALRAWTQRSRADLDLMHRDAAAARSGGQAACNALYGDAMVVLADLPSPDHALNRLVNDAAESYYRATQVCLFGVGALAPNLARGDAAMRQALGLLHASG